MEQMYCANPECDDPCDGHGQYCPRCTKRLQRGQSLSTPKAEKKSPLEKAIDIANLLAEASSDAEYDRLVRALKLACKVLGEDERKKVQGAAVRAGQARARARGVHIGPPFKLSPEEARELIAVHGSIAGAARAASVTRAAIRSALRTGEQMVSKSGLIDHPTECPREA